MREPKNMRERFIVLEAPGWPGGYEPVPNTLEYALKFQKEHGGRVMSRFVSDWVEIAEPE